MMYKIFAIYLMIGLITDVIVNYYTGIRDYKGQRTSEVIVFNIVFILLWYYVLVKTAIEHTNQKQDSVDLEEIMNTFDEEN